MKQETAQEHRERMFSLAREAFAEHKIQKTDGPLPEPRRWLIMRDGTSFYWVEIVHLLHGRLLVHGDISEVMWKDGPPDWRKAIDWVATADWSYAWEKCGRPSVRSENVMLAELFTEKATFMPYSNVREALDTAIHRLRCGASVEKVQQYIFDATADAELVSGLGCVPAPEFFYAWEAVKTLKRLLDALPKVVAS
jgi:hypothetical protein